MPEFNEQIAQEVRALRERVAALEKMEFMTGAGNYVKAVDYEDGDVLAKIKNVDGSGSGLDADKLDGTESSEFLRRTSANRNGVTRLFRREEDSAYNIQIAWDGSRWLIRGYLNDAYHAPARTEYADAAGNADTVDGYHAGSFLLANASTGIGARITSVQGNIYPSSYNGLSQYWLFPFNQWSSRGHGDEVNGMWWDSTYKCIRASYSGYYVADCCFAIRGLTAGQQASAGLTILRASDNAYIHIAQQTYTSNVASEARVYNPTCSFFYLTAGDGVGAFIYAASSASYIETAPNSWETRLHHLAIHRIA